MSCQDVLHRFSFFFLGFKYLNFLDIEDIIKIIRFIYIYILEKNEYFFFPESRCIIAAFGSGGDFSVGSGGQIFSAQAERCGSTGILKNS